MPRYHFHIEDGIKIEDREGTELLDLNAARLEAITVAADVLKSTAHYWNGTEWRMDVVDETGRSVLRLRLLLETDQQPG